MLAPNLPFIFRRQSFHQRIFTILGIKQLIIFYFISLLIKAFHLSLAFAYLLPFAKVSIGGNGVLII